MVLKISISKIMLIELVVFLCFAIVEFQCQSAQCPQMQPPPYRSLIRSCGTNYQDTCYITCPKGWDILGTCFRICQISGTWSGTDVMCVNKQFSCPPLTSPVNGFLEIPCLTYAGGVCKFSCSNGYQLIGSETIFCQESSTWSSQAPICSNGQVQTTTQGNPGINCGPLFAPVGGRLLSQCSGYLNDVCSFACENGYQLEGSSSLTCLPNGLWSGAVPTCRPGATICQGLNPPLNGYGEGTCANALEGQTCVFNCFAGYTLQGITSTTCRGGRWDGTPPICKGITCPALIQPPPNGQLQGSCNPGRLNDQCTLICDSGYNPQSTTVTCLVNGWSGALPVCMPTKCPSVNAQFTNGFLEGECNPGIGGQFCTFSCNPGYALVGNSTLVCQTDGNWSNPIPYCIRVSCAPQLLTSYGISVRPPNCANTVRVGTVCYFQCDSCNVIEGANQTMCNIRGEWTSTVPFCRPSTCEGLDVVNGYMQGACKPGLCGLECTIMCYPGFRLNGLSKLTCGANGLWSGAFPTCVQVQCPQLQPPQNGRLVGSCSGTVRTRCDVACDNCFEARGSSYLMCGDDGTWSPTQVPQCIRRQCPPINTPPNYCSIINCNNDCGNGQCTFQCQQGYLPSGPTTIRCIDGGLGPSYWDGQPPVCNPTNCPTLTFPAFSIGNEFCRTGAIGGQCIFTCNTGYVLQGGSNLQCLPTGQWSGTPPTCVRQQCLPSPLNPPRYGVWINRCTEPNCEIDVCAGEPGTECILKCGEGYKVQYQNRIRCDATSLQWVPALDQMSCIIDPAVQG